MKKYILFTVCLLGILLVGICPAGAYMINFDNIPQGTNIDAMDLGGVVIYSPDQSTRIAWATDGVGFRSPFNAATNDEYITPGHPMTLVFAVLQEDISFTGGDGGGDTDQFTVTAYGPTNNLLGTFTTPVFGGNPSNDSLMVDRYQVHLTFAGMKSLVISDAINAGIGIDNVAFCNNVPVPSALLLLASGLSGLVGLRKRWSK